MAFNKIKKDKNFIEFELTRPKFTYIEKLILNAFLEFRNRFFNIEMLLKNGKLTKSAMLEAIPGQFILLPVGIGEKSGENFTQWQNVLPVAVELADSFMQHAQHNQGESLAAKLSATTEIDVDSAFD